MSNAADQIDAAAVCRTDAGKIADVRHSGLDDRRNEGGDSFMSASRENRRCNAWQSGTPLPSQSDLADSEGSLFLRMTLLNVPSTRGGWSGTFGDSVAGQRRCGSVCGSF